MNKKILLTSMLFASTTIISLIGQQWDPVLGVNPVNVDSTISNLNSMNIIPIKITTDPKAEALVTISDAGGYTIPTQPILITLKGSTMSLWHKPGSPSSYTQVSADGTQTSSATYHFSPAGGAQVGDRTLVLIQLFKKDDPKFILVKTYAAIIELIAPEVS